MKLYDPFCPQCSARCTLWIKQSSLYIKIKGAWSMAGADQVPDRKREDSCSVTRSTFGGHENIGSKPSGRASYSGG